MDYNIKLGFGLISIVLTFVAYIPYMQAIANGRMKPHVFSWVIWTLSTLIVFVAQLDQQGGIGAWPIGLSGILTGWVAVQAYYNRSDITITRADWLFFWSALLATLCWFITADPLWTVVVLTIIDLLGFGPTFRKACIQPETESVAFYLIFAIRNLFAIVALESYSITTVLFPAALTLACGALVVLLLVWRRRPQQT